MAKKIVETPLMKQYLEMKRKHPDAVLLFRVGDFYETFSDDAVTTSEILGITLTRRANGAAQHVELAGFPHHALDTYLPKLVRAGKRVAICEQLEDPKLTKKLVKRGITELVTPGVSINDNLLNHRENNFVAAVHIDRDKAGVAFLDISTGEFLTAQGDFGYVGKLLTSFAPKEVLVERGKRHILDEEIAQRMLTFELDDWIFTETAAMDRLLKQFETGSLKGFGIHQMKDSVIASGAILHYLDITQHTHTSHIRSISRIEEERYVRLDRFTVRNLELFKSMGDEGKSLLDVIDRTVCPMGARLLRRWMSFPLRDVAAINRRLDVVEHFFTDPDAREELREAIARVGDLERLMGKAAAQRITPREVVQMRNALEALIPIRKLCLESGNEALHTIGEQLNELPALRERIARELNDDPPSQLKSGGVVRAGVDPELDELREIVRDSKSYLKRMQEREVELTGISSLKVGYNNVFGYYFEVTNTHRDKVPAEWIRKQTLVNAERYITPELKDYEEKILGAQEKIEATEARIYEKLVADLGGYIQAIQLDAALVARLDVLSSFTCVAIENRYNRPIVDDSLCIDLVEARHPVIERELPPGDPYISNTVHLDNATTQVMMITGPNMSGKSALLRQTALNVLLAQIGCYVAADSARIGVVDKIFTRVGASDNISLGESTFMVEMNEAASILNNMSARSLILFDELGRGTSTYDGISIAWAIVEYIHEYGQMHPKTLFATHYHELNEMERTFERVVNYNVSVKEIDGKVVFLRKLAKGGSAHSFGIHVAKLAGMPRSILKRADEVLRKLEEANRTGATDTTEAVRRATELPEGMQMSIFQLDDPVLSAVRDEIVGIDINSLSPLQALNKLAEIRTIITGK
ncbi:MAG: DNA mismatch repair protein MutS [Candidatus Amulumruptor caecigallinarius]|nr:DNA mismatch repair protein MutS [Candidatus Amulumruptor caecigallinarius]MCM1396889.1 DNA mismatch repair protein MutS [Candidatus Amulumruptor caecigallinarius]MCM1454167.1 DNA mismatch repair protein MutS [bacterium]